MASKVSISRLFEARSIAIIGASSDPNKLGSSPINAMGLMHYQGKISVVNPRYSELMGHPCFHSIDELPEDVEAAMIILPAPLTVEAAEACVRKGIYALVIVAQGFGEVGPEGEQRDARLLTLAQNHGAVICGPNTNGINNVTNGMAMSLTPILQYDGLVNPGRIGVVSQSGSMVSSILTHLGNRGIGIGKTATSGNELVLTVADYINYMVEDEELDLILLYLEAIRDIAAFNKALDYAKEVGKPIVAIKVGESESGKKAALSHTGAIAGSHRNTTALLEHKGVYVADDLETLACIAECLVRYDWSDTLEASKLFITAISGGSAVQTADLMARLDIPLESPSAEAVKALTSLPTQSHAINPYDIATQNALIPEIIDIFHKDGFNQLIFSLSLLKPEINLQLREIILKAKADGMDKIFVLSPKIKSEERLFFNNAGIALHDNAVPLLKALRAIDKQRTLTQLRKSINEEEYILPSINWPDTAGLLDEARSKTLLKKIGFHVPQSIVISTAEMPSGFDHLASPLVMKGLSSHITHKTELGLVALNLHNEIEVKAAWSNISKALAKADPSAKEILLEEMIGDGLEAILGVQHDPDLGPVVVVGAGGILCELLDDAVVLVPPFSSLEVKYRLAGTRFGRLLDGYRGRKYDIDALCQAAVKLGRLALATPRLDSMDINPVLVQIDSAGLIAVDAKIIWSNGV